MRQIFFSYMFVMPFMSAFAPTEWLPLPLILLIAALPFVMAGRRTIPLDFSARRDAGIVLMWLSGCLAILFSPISAGVKNVNYSIAMLICYVFFFCVTRAITLQARLAWTDVAVAARICLGFLSIAVVLEFYLASFHGVFYTDVLHFAHKDLTEAYFVNENYRRPRAFSAEPGFTALAFECLWPLTLIGGGGIWRRWWLHALYFAAFTVLASAAAMACLLSAMGIVWLLRNRDWRILTQFSATLLIIFLPMIGTESGQEIFWALFGRKFDLLAVNALPIGNAITLFDRLNSYEVGFDLLLSHPFGIGWGTLGQAFVERIPLGNAGMLNGSGLLNLHLDIGVAAGLLGLAGWLIFVGVRLRDVVTSPLKPSIYLAVALLSLFLHHLFVTEFQYPFLWFALALADKLALESRFVDRAAATPKQLDASSSLGGEL